MNTGKPLCVSRFSIENQNTKIEQFQGLFITFLLISFFFRDTHSSAVRRTIKQISRLHNYRFGGSKSYLDRAVTLCWIHGDQRWLPFLLLLYLVTALYSILGRVRPRLSLSRTVSFRFSSLIALRGCHLVKTSR